MMNVLTSRFATRKRIFHNRFDYAAGFAASCSSNPSPLTRHRSGRNKHESPARRRDSCLVNHYPEPQALNAQQDNARKSEAVMQALKVSGALIQKSRLPTTAFNRDTTIDTTSLKIIGYEARNSVMVTMGDLTKVGAVIDAASRAGANSVESVSFILRDNSPARGQASRKHRARQ